MARSPLRDLEPYGDVKGGSPRTPPGGIPVSEYQSYAMPVNGNGVWKAIATGLGGLVVGLLVAWFTAFSGKGVTQKELQEYVDRWSQSKEAIIAAQQSNQDRDIGVLQGKQERILDRVNGHDNKINELEHGQIEFKTKLDLVATYLEEERKGKK